MTVKSHDANGFVISTAKFGTELGTVRIEYANVSQEQLQWAIRNGFSQAMTDSHAGDTEEAAGSKEKAIEAAKASVADWAEKIAAGHVPSSGIGRARLSPEEKALREVTSDWLISAGLKVGDARKLVASESMESIVNKLAHDKVAKTGEGNAVEMAAARVAKLQQAAAKLLAAKAPEADGEF